MPRSKHHVSDIASTFGLPSPPVNVAVRKEKDGLQSSSPPKPEAKHPLIGMFLHTFENGLLQYGARIVGIDGDTVLAQLFSALSGDPTSVRAFEKSFIYSGSCRLYPDADSWNADCDAICRREKPHYQKLAREAFSNLREAKALRTQKLDSIGRK